MPILPGEEFESFWSSTLGVAVAMICPLGFEMKSDAIADVRDYTERLLREYEKAVLGSQFSKGIWGRTSVRELCPSTGG
jgi:hypothetical protein